jgi:hypothetical protein
VCITETVDALAGNADSQPLREGLESLPGRGGLLRQELHLAMPSLGISAKARWLAILLLPLALTACMDSDESRPTSFITDSNDADQPFPHNYRTEVLAFLHTYLNNPVGVHDASVAEPVQRTVGGRVRYVACVRFAERQSDGGYREPRERAVIFVNGRLDRIAQNAGEVCAGAVYAAFPELEKMVR